MGDKKEENFGIGEIRTVDLLSASLLWRTLDQDERAREREREREREGEISFSSYSIDAKLDIL